MPEFKTKITAFGLDEATLPARTKKKIAVFNELEASLQNTKLKAADRSEIEAAIESLDAELSKDIERFNKNKDFYAKQAEKLRAHHAAKKQGTAVAEQPAAVEEQQIEQPAGAGTAEAVAPVIIEPAKPEITATNEEKDSSGIGWLVAAAGLALAFFGIRAMRD